MVSWSLCQLSQSVRQDTVCTGLQSCQGPGSFSLKKNHFCQIKSQKITSVSQLHPLSIMTEQRFMTVHLTVFEILRAPQSITAIHKLASGSKTVFDLRNKNFNKCSKKKKERSRTAIQSGVIVVKKSCTVTHKCDMSHSTHCIARCNFAFSISAC